MRKLSKQELDRMFAEERRKERQANKVIYGPDGKPLNNRKKKGASKAIMQQMIVSKLYQDGFIVKEGDIFKVDASGRIEETYGKYRKAEVVADIRAILKQLVYGFHKMGITVEVDGVRWEGEKETGSEDNSTGQRDEKRIRILEKLRGPISNE